MKLLIVDNSVVSSGSFSSNYAMGRLLFLISVLKKQNTIKVDGWISQEWLDYSSLFEKCSYATYNREEENDWSDKIKKSGFELETYDLILTTDFNIRLKKGSPLGDKLVVFEKGIFSDYPFLPCFSFYSFTGAALIGAEQKFLNRFDDRLSTLTAEQVRKKLEGFARNLPDDFGEYNIEKLTPLPFLEHPNIIKFFGKKIVESFYDRVDSIELNECLTTHRQQPELRPVLSHYSGFNDAVLSFCETHKTCLTVSLVTEFHHLHDIDRLRVFVNDLEASPEISGFRDDLPINNGVYPIHINFNLDLFSVQRSNAFNENFEVLILIDEKILFKRSINSIGVVDEPFVFQRNVGLKRFSKKRNALRLESVFYRFDLSPSSALLNVIKHIELTGSKSCANYVLLDRSIFTSLKSKISTETVHRQIHSHINRHIPVTSIKLIETVLFKLLRGGETKDCAPETF